MFSGPDSMLQKLLLQLVISMHFQSFIGKLIIINHFFENAFFSTLYMIIKLLSDIDFLKEIPSTFAANMAGWTWHLFYLCSLFTHGVIFVVFDTARYLAIVPKR